jgi:type I restriction enzyme M protein
MTDPACGSGVLTESKNFIKDEDGEIRAVNSDVYLYGKKSMTRLMLFAKVI